MLTYRLKGTKVFAGTTTTNTDNGPAVPEVGTTGDHRRIFANHGAPTGRRSADLAHYRVVGGVTIAAENSARCIADEDPSRGIGAAGALPRNDRF